MIIPAFSFITSIDTALERAITDGMERSTFPGPVVITSICPRETRTVKAEKVKAAVRICPPPCPPETQSVTSQAPNAPRKDQIQGIDPMRDVRPASMSDRLAASA